MNKRELKQYVAKSEISGLLDRLLNLPFVLNESNDLYDRVIMVSALYNSTIVDCKKGTISFEQRNLNIARINDTLIRIINDLPKNLAVEDRIKVSNDDNKLIKIVITDDLNNFNSHVKNSLIGVISGLLEISRDKVIVKRIKSGSIIVILEVPKKSIKTIAQIRNNELPSKIKSIKPYRFYDRYIHLYKRRLFGLLFFCAFIVFIIYNPFKESVDTSNKVYYNRSDYLYPDRSNKFYDDRSDYFDSSNYNLTILEFKEYPGVVYIKGIIVSNGLIPIFSQPDIESTRIGSLTKGDTVKAAIIVGKNEWALVEKSNQLDTKHGYIYSGFLK